VEGLPGFWASIPPALRESDRSEYLGGTTLGNVAAGLELGHCRSALQSQLADDPPQSNARAPRGRDPKLLQSVGGQICLWALARDADTSRLGAHLLQ
jgi:hypothetical protein